MPMCIERVILCGSVREDRLPAADADPVRLRRWGPRANVNLMIEDVRRAQWADLPSAFVDLIDIATYVYCADQAIPRGGDGVRDFGERWRRKLHLRIPVRQPEIWNNGRVMEELVSTLSFLSEDQYHFEFELLKKDRSLEGYINFNEDPFGGTVQEVVMFSGGLDSLAGAVKEALVDKRKIILVNHRSTTKPGPRQRHLARLLENASATNRPIHIPVRINKDKNLGREYTQRSRSFLYVSLGATFARMVGLNRVRFYENGVVSLNLPPSAQVVGARATRTTHPQVLNGFSKLLTLLSGSAFTVENPFLCKTKTEVVKLIAEAGCSGMIRYSTSCTRTWEQTRLHSHCGTCSQCIDRRFAVLAADQEAADPAEAYGVDLLVGERQVGDPRTMLAAYLETANEIAKMDALQFFSRYGEASRVLRHIDDNPEAAAIKVFDLHRRHAAQVTGVVDEAIRKNAAAIRLRELPPSCLLRLVCDSSGVVAPAAEKAGPEMGDSVFRKKGQVWEVRFAAGQDFILLPSMGAAYLHILLSAPGASFSALDLACRVNKGRAQYALGDAGEKTDHDALGSYRARIIELKEDLEEAKANNDPGQQQKIQEEIEELVKEIRKSRGLGGRLRKVSDDSDRVRKAVGNAIKRAVLGIAQYDPRLAEHLRPPRLSCGSNLTYTPTQDLVWETEAAAPAAGNKSPLHEM